MEFDYDSEIMLFKTMFMGLCGQMKKNYNFINKVQK